MNKTIPDTMLRELILSLLKNGNRCVLTLSYHNGDVIKAEAERETSEVCISDFETLDEYEQNKIHKITDALFFIFFIMKAQKIYGYVNIEIENGNVKSIVDKQVWKTAGFEKDKSADCRIISGQTIKKAFSDIQNIQNGRGK